MNLEKTIRFKDLHPENFTFVESLHLQRSFNGEGGIGLTDLTLRLVKTPDCWADTLIIVFTGVQDLQIEEIGAFGGLFLDIQSTKGHGIEGASYRVSNLEQGKFSLYCYDFSFLLSRKGSGQSTFP